VDRKSAIAMPDKGLIPSRSKQRFSQADA